MMPFMYRIDSILEANEKWVVKIASKIDYINYNSKWMDDDVLGKSCMIPSLDLEESHYEFATEKEAINFIKEWWKKQ